MATDLAGLSTALADRYRIDRELGQGGMATVYLAEDVRHKRKVALKVLHPELSAVLGPERILKEIELTASRQHPHIVPLFESGSAGGQLYYVMPFVEGETLRARLEREAQLPVVHARRRVERGRRGRRVLSDADDLEVRRWPRGRANRPVAEVHAHVGEGRRQVADHRRHVWGGRAAVVIERCSRPYLDVYRDR